MKIDKERFGTGFKVSKKHIYEKAKPCVFIMPSDFIPEADVTDLRNFLEEAHEEEERKLRESNIIFQLD